MDLPIIFLSLILLQSALAAPNDGFDSVDSFNLEDDTEVEPYMDRKARNDKFLRFGRRFWDYDTSNDIIYDDSEVQRPPRTGSLNGNPQERTARDKGSFLRFGRSITKENKKKRGKRGAVPSSDGLKRHESYLRFGRNSNFMRFGRNIGHSSVPSQIGLEAFLKRVAESHDDSLINYLKNLLKQSEKNMGHDNEI